MNFHVYLDEDLGKQIQDYCLTTHKKRNAIVREALRFYFSQQKTAKWPDSILTFQGLSDFPSFESYRNDQVIESHRSFLD